MKLLSALIIASLLLSSCQKNQEKATENSALQNVESPAESNASLPYLIKGGDDLLYMSWVEKRDSGWIDLKYSVQKEDIWQTPEVIASGNDWFVNWADYPMMAVDKQGNMIAHFLAKSSSGTYSYDVNVVYKPVGGEWSEPIIPHDDGTPTEHGFVTMLPKNDGTFLLSWLDGRNTGGGDHDSGGHGGGGAMTIRTATLDMMGNLTQKAELDSRVCDCCQTGGAMTLGGPVIVYRDRSEEEMRDMSFVRFVDNNWTESKAVNSDGWKIAGCPVNGPRIAAYENTTATAWFTAAEGIAKVKVAFMDDSGASFQEPIIVDDSVSVGRVDIVMIDNQSAYVSWLDLEGETPLIKFRKVSKNGSMNDPIIVSETSASRGSGFPQMELIDGTLFFAWTNVEEDKTSVSLSQFKF
ncbi:exo-alpha-sialidase [Ekhidna sp. MALMAid0563]|uniref:exo-alpha-sialidase n=1 Tax=unclassified Ekhidna TaxID=2632188 RepID=UPI0032DEF972